MILNLVAITACIIINFIVYKKIDLIIKHINIYDKPGGIKIHKKKILKPFKTAKNGQ